MFKFMTNLAIALAILHYARAVCNICNDNGVACKNEKEFHPCFNGIANTSITFSCAGENKVCTKSAPVCMNKTLNSVTPACGDTSNCGKCGGEEDDGKFTCTSRTTYTMCSGGELSEIRESCPKNQMCNVDLAKQGKFPCVPDCREREIEFCDLYDAIDGPVTTTIEPSATTELPTTTDNISGSTITLTTGENNDSTTEIANTTVIFSPTPPPVTTTTQLPANQFCSQQTTIGRYPHPTDMSCKSYILCFIQGGKMQTIILECPPGRYYYSSSRLCVKFKPAGCD